MRTSRVILSRYPGRGLANSDSRSWQARWHAGRLRRVRAGEEHPPHSRYDAVTLDPHGPVGDRAFCLIGADNGKVLKTVPHRALLAVTARWDGAALELSLPSGETASGAPVPSGERVTCEYWGRSVTHELTDGPHSELLSAYLGKGVRLTIPPRGGGVYGAPVSIIGPRPRCAISASAPAAPTCSTRPPAFG